MHEDLLRHIWKKKLFDESHLVTTDGQIIHIKNPGTLSRTSGPDFRDAEIKIDRITYKGDIEFHRTIEDWKLHNHQNDPNYNSVILHVVLQGKAEKTSSQSGRAIPTIILEMFLSTPLEKIADQLSREEYSSRNNRIKCYSVNDAVDSALLNQWIKTLYRERLQEKVQRLYIRLCDIIVSQQKIIGEPHPPYNETLDPNDIPLPDSQIDKNLFRQKLPWEQLLYEEVMDGFGYSNNREPMRKLAEHVSLITLITQMEAIDQTDKIELSPQQIQALLFKISGLLPDISKITVQDSKVYIHSLNTAWNELPKKISLLPLQSSQWNFSPTRPSNFPTIRIAAAGISLHKLLYHSLFKSIVMTVGGKFSSPRTKIEQLLSLLDVGDDSFWNYHYSFIEATHQKHALLGDSRKFDIIVNTIVPFVCLYARIFGKNDLAEHCLNLAVELPLLEDNSILRTMNKQLVKGKVKIEFAFQQQGLIQLNKKYCVVERCGECEVGKKVFLSFLHPTSR